MTGTAVEEAGKLSTERGGCGETAEGPEPNGGAFGAATERGTALLDEDGWTLAPVGAETDVGALEAAILAPPKLPRASLAPSGAPCGTGGGPEVGADVAAT